jgi:hypothetical protein
MLTTLMSWADRVGVIAGPIAQAVGRIPANGFGSHDRAHPLHSIDKIKNDSNKGLQLVGTENRIVQGL